MIKLEEFLLEFKSHKFYVSVKNDIIPLSLVWPVRSALLVIIKLSPLCSFLFVFVFPIHEW